MLRFYFVNICVLLISQASTRSSYAAIVHNAPSNVTVSIGETFSITCGISYIEENDKQTWIRYIKNKPVIISVGDLGTYGPDKNRQHIEMTPTEYTIVVNNATTSDEGVYQCGVFINTLYNPLANTTVTVLQVRTAPTTTRHAQIFGTAHITGSVDIAGKMTNHNALKTYWPIEVHSIQQDIAKEGDGVILITSSSSSKEKSETIPLTSTILPQNDELSRKNEQCVVSSCVMFILVGLIGSYLT